MGAKLSPFVFAFFLFYSKAEDRNDYWPHWRGPLLTGEAPNASPPTTWSEEKNIRWKTPLVGEGHSTPVIWGDLIFITAARETGEKFEPIPDTAEGAHDNRFVDSAYTFHVLAHERATGKLLWDQKVCDEIPHEGGYVTGSLASNSAVTDGERVFAFFGSRGLYALSIDGVLLWKKSLGRMNTRHAHGEGASPVLHGSTLVVNWDHEGDSFIVALDAKTGEEKWRKARDENTSWSTPITVEYENRVQVIVSATNRIRSYDVKDGALIWECGGLSRNVVASPVYADGMVYCSNSYDWRILMAISLKGASGDLTKSDNVVWSHRWGTSYVPSPLLMNERLYYLGHLSGILSVAKAQSGELEHRRVRLPDIQNVYASPLGADHRLYFSDMDGTTTVLEHNGDLKVVAVNQLDDRFVASPVAVGKRTDPARAQKPVFNHGRLGSVARIYRSDNPAMGSDCAGSTLSE